MVEHRRRRLPQKYLFVIGAVLTAAVSLGQQEDLRVRLVAPTADTFASGPTTIRAEITTAGDTSIASVTFSVDGAVVAVLEEPPWETIWDAGETFARHLITVEVVDVTGRTAEDTVVTRDLETAVFRAEVAVVLLYVTVLDNRDAYVANLEADDFEVFEDGKRQQITHFASEPRPLVAGLLLDTSGSMQGLKIERARQGALAFLDQVSEQDQLFAMTFDTYPNLVQDLTANTALLREALSDLTVQGATSMNMAIVEGVDLLAERAERRAVIVLSDGYDTAETITTEQAIDYARHQDVRLYTIGIFDGGAGGFGRRFGGGFDSINPGENSLRSFADGTGGRSIILDSLGELLQAYEQIAAELRSQYALAYRPSDPPRTGEWHDIEVRARGGKTVRTKPGYFGGERP